MRMRQHEGNTCENKQFNRSIIRMQCRADRNIRQDLPNLTQKSARGNFQSIWLKPNGERESLHRHTLFHIYKRYLLFLVLPRLLTGRRPRPTAKI